LQQEFSLTVATAAMTLPDGTYVDRGLTLSGNGSRTDSLLQQLSALLPAAASSALQSVTTGVSLPVFDSPASALRGTTVFIRIPVRCASCSFTLFNHLIYSFFRLGKS
jgi:hypothetical protein